MSEEQPPIFATPRRKTARMSTGRKPPPIKSSLASKFFDLEAEESGDNSASEGGNTSDEDDGEEGSIPWERTPTPSRADLTVASDTKNPDSGSTEAKDATVDAVEQEPWDPKTHRVLDTQGHNLWPGRNYHAFDKTWSGNAGLAAKATYIGPDSYQAFWGEANRNHYSARTGRRRHINCFYEDTPVRIVPFRILTYEFDLSKSSLPSPEIEERTSVVQAKVVDKGKKPVKRKRVNSIESVNAPASSPADIFAAKRSEAASSPPKKITKTDDHVDQTFLEEHEIKRVSASSLPAQCQVTNRELQDMITYHVYLGLPKLLAGTFIAWSSREGPGMFMISEFASSTPDIDFETLWSCFVFVSKEQFVNLARANPLNFIATSQIYSTDMKRWVLEFNERTAICVSIVCVVASAVTKARHVNPPSSGSKNASKIPVLKFVTGIHLSQDYDRVVGLLSTVFQHPEMHAQLNEDALTFGTKSTTLEKIKKSRSSASTSSGTRSSATRYRTSNYTSSQDSLSWEDEVPVYDARHTPFRADRDIDNLDRLLPRYENHGGEIPNGSCALVAYTVSQYKKMPANEEHVSFNIRFAVVLAEPA
ncbi:hypothetical protein R3P38DRAFT_3560892 [Favolaschia claudopus]|uniref:Uncharacterized protein n=1 Tax=Favolaschia claudopus TaxID=2862362 RepID=A0AAW0AY76_9AGAR